MIRGRTSEGSTLTPNNSKEVMRFGEAGYCEKAYEGDAKEEAKEALEDFLDYWISCLSDEEFLTKRILVFPVNTKFSH